MLILRTLHSAQSFIGVPIVRIKNESTIIFKEKRQLLWFLKMIVFLVIFRKLKIIFAIESKKA